MFVSLACILLNEFFFFFTVTVLFIYFFVQFLSWAFTVDGVPTSSSKNENSLSSFEIIDGLEQEGFEGQRDAHSGMLICFALFLNFNLWKKKKENVFVALICEKKLIEFLLSNENLSLLSVSELHFLYSSHV